MLQFVDWLYYSDEGLEFAKWGVEGTTYTKDGDDPHARRRRRLERPEPGGHQEAERRLRLQQRRVDADQRLHRRADPRACTTEATNTFIDAMADKVELPLTPPAPARRDGARAGHALAGGAQGLRHAEHGRVHPRSAPDVRVGRVRRPSSRARTSSSTSRLQQRARPPRRTDGTLDGRSRSHPRRRAGRRTARTDHEVASTSPPSPPARCPTPGASASAPAASTSPCGRLPGLARPGPARDRLPAHPRPRPALRRHGRAPPVRARGRAHPGTRSRTSTRWSTPTCGWASGRSSSWASCRRRSPPATRRSSGGRATSPRRATTASGPRWSGAGART